MTTVSTLSILPEAPTREMASSEFAEKADLFLPGLNTLQTEMNVSIGQINTVAGEINTNAGTATTAAGTATTQAGLAIAAAEAAATLTDGSINDSVTDLTHTYSSQKINTTYQPKTGSDDQVSRQMLIDCGYTFLDKGNSSTTTQTLDYTAGSHQKITATGNFTIALSNFPPTGNLGELLLELVNGGSQTITFPAAINWIKPDGTTTTSISDYLTANTGRTALQTSGTDFILLWSRDAGTIVYGRLV